VPPLCGKRTSQWRLARRKKSWQIPELINQVAHRETTESEGEFCGLERASKGVHMQPTTGAFEQTRLVSTKKPTTR
jgi:hypothetical protein